MVPLVATVLLRISVDVSRAVLGRSWVVQTALAGAMVTRFSDYLFLDWRLAVIGETGLRWRF
mgnify:CR=1 FL=1